TPSSGRTALADGAPPWAGADRFVGAAEADEVVHVSVHMVLRNLEAALAEVEAITSPSNPRYGQYLTAEETLTRYGPSESDVFEVRYYLESQGLVVDDVPDNRRHISAHGTVSQLESAFETRVGLYRVGATAFRAPMRAPSLPSAIASRVTTVVGLD